MIHGTKPLPRPEDFLGGPRWCTRCGMEGKRPMRSDRPDPWVDGECPDCQAVPVDLAQLVVPERVEYRAGNGHRWHCRPWDGDLDEEWRPVDAAGELVLPGRRKCGHSDCVNSGHVLAPTRRYTQRRTTRELVAA